MSDPGRLAISVTHADGRTTRWGPDEPSATEIPGDLTFGTQIPGGDKDLSCSLLRRIDLDYPDQAPFDLVRVFGPGNRSVWGGRMAQFPRSHGDGYQIVPGAVGRSSELTDDPSFMEVYVDRDPSHWVEPPIGRRIAISAGPFYQDTVSLSREAGGLVWSFPASVPATDHAETWWIAPAGVTAGRLGYRGASVTVPAGFETPLVYTNTSRDATGGFASTALTLDDTLRSATFSAQPALMLRSFNSGGVTATPAAGSQRRFTKVAVYGSHGLTLHAISGEPDGVYASDVVQDIVTRTAPDVTVGEIEATAYAIPHLVFLDPTTGESAIQLVNGYHGFDWGVYDGEFFFRSSDATRLTWQARLSDGARLDLEGETAEQIFNGVYVTYQDPNGQKKTVGPPGASADATDAALADTSATNPVNSHGISRRWGMLEISQVTTLAGATQVGSIWLSAHGTPQRRGTLSLTGTARHPTEGDVPVWRVRAGDYISIADHPADIPRRIIETRYTHGARQIILNLDNTPYMLDALLQRFGAGLVGVL